VVIKTHPNASFTWEGIGPGRGCVYAWGNAGGNGEIYKVLFDPNTGSLATAASFASYLPDGETIHALQFYAGGIIMGTGRGVRIGQADGTGNIDYGPLIETEWPVRCLEPQNRYCWFGWSRYDDDTSGLGRIDLGFLADTLTPAWASDLMTSDTSTGDTVSCVTFSPYGYTADQRPPVRVFTVAGEGLYIEDPNSRVPTGELAAGAVRYSTSEAKHARTVDLLYHVSTESAGSLEVDAKVDEASDWTALTESTPIVTGGTSFTVDEIGESFEIRIRLGRGGIVDGRHTSLEVIRWSLKSLPIPSTVDEILAIPIIMTADSLTRQGDGTPYPIDVPAEISYLLGLERARTIVDVQLGDEVISDCYVAGHQFQPWRWSDGNKHLEGIFVVQIATAHG
ncbi:MAG TPA: hypothetical protein VEG38_16630, partial [Acidimicrobiia bacterium]|nr:hypothetical protein [Acidimicrobiia bacterium]